MRSRLHLVLLLGLAAAVGVVASALPLSAGSNTIQMAVQRSASDPDPFLPMLDLFSFANCSNDGKSQTGDRFHYVGSGYTPSLCDGPYTYVYDRGPPGKTIVVFVRTLVTDQGSGAYLVDFFLYTDAQCLNHYNFMPTPGASARRVQQFSGTCQTYTNDLYNPTKVVSASIYPTSAAPPAATGTVLSVLLLAAITSFLQPNH